jgi:hypothetical protein
VAYSVAIKNDIRLFTIVSSLVFLASHVLRGFCTLFQLIPLSEANSVANVTLLCGANNGNELLNVTLES